MMYTIVPCAVNVPVSNFERLQSSVVTPVIVARSICPKSNAGNMNVATSGPHNNGLWE